MSETTEQVPRPEDADEIRRRQLEELQPNAEELSTYLHGQAQRRSPAPEVKSDLPSFEIPQPGSLPSPDLNEKPPITGVEDLRAALQRGEDSLSGKVTFDPDRDIQNIQTLMDSSE